MAELQGSNAETSCASTVCASTDSATATVGQQRGGGPGGGGGTGPAPQFGGGLAGLGLDAKTNTPHNPFRPPPGFMDSAPGQQAPAQTEDPQARRTLLSPPRANWWPLAGEVT